MLLLISERLRVNVLDIGVRVKEQKTMKIQLWFPSSGASDIIFLIAVSFYEN